MSVIRNSLEEVPKFERVHIYKSGFATLEKLITLKPSTTCISIEKCPFAIHGTLMFEPVKPGSVTITSVIKTESVKEFLDQPCNSIRDVLKANVDGKVTLLLEDKSQHMGIIKEVTMHCVFLTIPSKDNEVAKDGCIEIKHIKHVFGPSLKTKCIKRRKKKFLKVTYEKLENEVNVIMKYMTKDVLWVPFYHFIFSKNERSGTMIMNATILNDIESFMTKDLKLTSGTPNITYSRVCDCIISNQSISQFVSSLLNNGANSNSFVMKKPIDEGYLSEEDSCSEADDIDIKQTQNNGSGSGNFLPEEENNGKGSNVKDYYHYELKNICSERNSRTQVPITRISAPFEKLYRSEIIKGTTPKNVPVTNAIRIKNLGDVPWSTGAVSIFNHEGSFLGQNKITFTPKNTHNEVILMKCMSILVTYTSTEKVTKKIKKGVFSNYRYEQYTTKSEISLKNLQEKNVFFLLKFHFEGAFVSCTEKDCKVIGSGKSYSGDQNDKCSLDVKTEIGTGKKSSKKVKIVHTWLKRFYN